MPIINMSDGRNFTEYRSSREQMASYRQQHNTLDSKSLRHSLMHSNTEQVSCTPKQASGMSVMCGGPMSQYVSKKSTITDFPTGPLKSTQ